MLGDTRPIIVIRPTDLGPPAPQPRGGIYTATVVSADDPEQRGRLRLRIPHVHPTDVHPAWALPRGVAWGTAAQRWIAPPVGAVVLVMFLDGNVDVPLWEPGPFPPSTDANGRPTPGKVPVVAQSQQRPGEGPSENPYPSVRVLWRDDRGLLVTENAAGEVDVSTSGRPLRVKTNGGRIEIDARDGSGGEVVLNRGEHGAARKTDAVRVTIPAGTVVVALGPGPVAVMNALDIELDGEITGGSDGVKIG